MIRAALLVSAVALSLGLAAAHAQSAQEPKSPPPVRWRDNPPSQDDLPPLSRGPAPALYLANSGLRSGTALVHAGTRVFALCWNAGTGPYSVELRDPSGAALLKEINISETLLVGRAQPINFAPGLYTVLVTDQSGHGSEGHFQVVAATPRLQTAAASANGDNTAAQDALQLADLGAAYRYEAFLTLAQGQPSPADDNLRNRLCHR